MISGHEMFLTIRARDEASNTIRRISANVERMRSITQLKQDITAAQTAAAAAAQKQLRYAQGIQTLEGVQAQRWSRMTQLAKDRQMITQKMAAGEAHLNRLQQVRQSVLQKAFQLEADRAAIESKMNAAVAQRNMLMQAGLPYSSQLNNLTAQYGHELNAARDEVLAIMRELDGVDASIKGINMTQDKWASRLAAITAEMEGLTAAYKEGQITLAQYTAEVEKLAAAEAHELAIAKARTAELAEVRRQNVLRASQATSALGRVMQFGGGAVLAGAGFAANSFADFSTKVTLAATQTGKLNRSVVDIGATVNRLMPMLLGQMSRFPASADDISTSIYDIFSSLDVNMKQGVRALTISQRAAVAGQTDLNSTANAGITILSNFGGSVNALSGYFNRAFAAVRFGRFTMDEFNQSLATTAPAAKQTGQTFNNLAGTIAFLSRSLGINKGAVGYARLLQTLVSPKMVEGLKKHGISVRDAAGHYKQLDQIMTEIANKFPRLVAGQESAQNFFKNLSGTQSTIQASRAFTTLIRNMGGYHSVLNRVVHDNNAFAQQQKALFATPGVQWKIFTNSLHELWLELGRAVIPAFKELVPYVREATDWFHNLSDSQRSLLGKILVIGSALSVLAGTFLVVTATVASFFATVGGSGGVAMGFVSVAKAGAGLAAALYLIYTNWDLVKGIAVQAAQALEPLYNLIKQIPSGVLQWISQTIALMVVITQLIRVIGALKAAVIAFEASNPLGWIAIAAGAVVSLKMALDQASTSTQTLNTKQGELLNTIKGVSDAIQGEIDKLRNIPGDAESVARDKIAVAQARATLATAKKDVREATTPAERRAAILREKQAVLDLGDALNKLAQDRKKGAGDRRALSDSVRDFKQANDQVQQLEQKQRRDKQILAGLEKTGMDTGLGKVRYDAVRAALKAVDDQLKTAKGHLQDLGDTWRRAVIGNLTKMQNLQMIPKLNKQQVDQALSFVEQQGRMPTAKEVKQIVKIDVQGRDKIKGADQAVRNLFKYIDDHHSEVKWTFNPPVAKANSLAAALGRGISSGVLSGVQGLGPALYSQLSADALSALHHTQMLLGIKSPSKVFADQVGKPIAQGIVAGMIKEAGGYKEATKTVTDFLLQAFKSDLDASRSAFGQLFQGGLLQEKIDWGATLNIGDLTADLRKQSQTFAKWHNSLTTLSRRGAPQQLIQQLRDLGPESQNELDALLHATPQQLKQYVALWRHAQTQIQGNARTAFDAQRREWQSHGRSIALGIMLGIKDEMPALQNQMRHLALTLINTLRRHNRSHSPSKLYQKEGENMLLGLQMGMTTFRPSFGAVDRLNGNGRVANTGNVINYTQNIYANNDESFERTNRRALFHFRNTAKRYIK